MSLSGYRFIHYYISDRVYEQICVYERSQMIIQMLLSLNVPSSRWLYSSICFNFNHNYIVKANPALSSDITVPFVTDYLHSNPHLSAVSIV